VVERLESRPELALIRLTPAEPATRPNLSAVNLYPAWTPAQVGTRAPVTLHAMGGWFDAEQEGEATWRWAGRRAEVALWVAGEESRHVLLSAELRSLAPGRLTLHVNDALRQSWDLDRGPVTLDALPLLLPAGSTRLTWHFDGALIRPGGDRRALGFQLIGLRAQLGP
jgi:hypothetical protein